MIDFSYPVQTRDGRTVRILATDAGGACPVVALVTETTGVAAGEQLLRRFTKEGRYISFHQTAHDLVPLESSND